MSAEALNRLVGQSGSFLLTGTDTITPSQGINFCALVAGTDGAGIDTITLEKINEASTVGHSVYEYSDKDGTFTWDGQTIGAGEIIEIPDGYRVKTIKLTSGYMKGLLADQVELKEVV